MTRQHTLSPAPLTPYPALARIALLGNLVAFGFLGTLVVWSAVAPLESVAIAGGALEVETRRKTLQHLEGGIVSAILVDDGDRVAAGDVLVRLDDTHARADLQILRGRLREAEALHVRLRAERAGADQLEFPQDLVGRAEADAALAGILAAQQRIFESRRGIQVARRAIYAERRRQVENEIIGLEAQLAAAETQSDIVGEEVATVAALVERGLATRPRLLALDRERAAATGRLGETAARIARARQVIAETEADLLTLERTAASEATIALHDAEAEIRLVSEQIEAAEDKFARTRITAPEAGTVTDLRIHTPGGVLAPGEAVADLVPDGDRLIAAARLRPEDVDVVRSGQSVEVHLSSFDQRRVAPLAGEVARVSPDRLSDEKTGIAYYALHIRLDDERLRGPDRLALSPGMPVQVFVRTGESTVLLYALRPLLDSFGRAFRED